MHTKVNLKKYNTFGIASVAENFIKVSSLSMLLNLSKTNLFNKQYFILGCGSNVLFTQEHFTIPILKINIKGIHLNLTKSYLEITCGAGEYWDNIVELVVNKGIWGFENLSLIPGSVGASVVQNIGAYGVEISKYVKEVKYFDPVEKIFKVITNEQCSFGYRYSIFKDKLKKSIIVSVTFLIPLTEKPNLEYADLANYLLVNNISINSLDPKLLRSIIINIRKNKIPYPEEVGNSGSFFKNPVVNASTLLKIKEQHPDIKYTEIDKNNFKIPAGWLIEKSGWKGWTSSCGRFGVSNKHALVLVNYKNAKGKDIYNLAQTIKKSVIENFGIQLEEEVVIL